MFRLICTSHHRALYLLTGILLIACVGCSSSTAGGAIKEQGPLHIDLGEEYKDYQKLKGGASSPQSQESSAARAVVLYFANRFLDLFDIPRADIGIGPSFGGVIRITRYGQFGYRGFLPLSLRAGLRGRAMPIFIERSSEIGAGPAFLQSHERDITLLEVGGGVDLLLVGAHASVSLDEALDFLLGWFGLDISKDDYK